MHADIPQDRLKYSKWVFVFFNRGGTYSNSAHEYEFWVLMILNNSNNTPLISGTVEILFSSYDWLRV
jgi:hypothetical protein